MNRIGAVAVMVGAGLVLCAGNLGCYLDQLQATQRENRILQQEKSRLAADLLDAEALVKQKETELDGTKKQLATEQDRSNSLTAENQSLRDALKKAQDILEAQAGKGVGPVHIYRAALPPAVDKALKDLQAQYPDLLDYDSKTGAVRWKADLLFPLGSDQLSDSSSIMEPLKKFAAIVNSEDAKNLDVVIIGHTCTTPIAKPATRAEHKTNWHLSAHRAIAIMNMLGGANVVMSRMGVMGYGEYRPIADNGTKDGKSKNRRVEIYLVQRNTIASVAPGVYESQDKQLTFVKPADLSKKPARTAPTAAKAEESEN